MERSFEGERILIAINADSVEFDANFNPGCATLWDMTNNIEETATTEEAM